VDNLKYRRINNAELCSQLPICGSSVFFSYLPYHVFRQFRRTRRLTSLNPVPRHFIAGVVCVRTFKKMTRINAKRSIASMTCHLVRPMTVCNKESYSMGAVNFSVESHTPVPICQFRERPKDIHVRTVVFDDISKPNALRFSLSSFKTPSQSSKLFWGGTMFGRLGLHRCSPEASVLGRGRFGERLGSFQYKPVS